MDAILTPPQHFSGHLAVPADKAICHRAVLAAALAHGTTLICPWPSADDCQRTLTLVQALGAHVDRLEDAVQITGTDGHPQAPAGELFCGESGTTLRLAAGLLAGQPFLAHVIAGPSLSQRPMQRVIEPLCRMGAQLEGTARVAGSSERYPPLTIQGCRPLRPIRYAPPVASAQVKSAVLLAGLFAEGSTTVVESQPTRDHTERMLSRFGVVVKTGAGRVSVTPGRLTAPGTIELPGDFSSAAFFIVAASCVPGARLTLEGVSMNPSRTKLLEVLMRMGASIRTAVTSTDSWEPRGRIEVTAQVLRAVTLEAHEVPAVIDEVPILMVAAACAQGQSRLHGLGELRVKETDRVISMMTGLTRLGCRVSLDETQTITIEGGPLRGGVVDSFQDHRTAMSLAVAGLVATGSTTVTKAECVAKSFPEFFDYLRQLAGSSTVKTVDKV